MPNQGCIIHFLRWNYYAISAQKNVPEKNRTKGRKPRLRFSVGQAAVGGVAHTILLCAVLAYPIIFIIF
jgi:hypothetical protein